MDSDNLTPNCEDGELGEEGGQEIYVSDDVKGSDKSDSFVVDIERFSHLIKTDFNANSKIRRSLSRKGSVRIGDKRIIGNERENSMPAVASPRAVAASALRLKGVVAVVGCPYIVILPAMETAATLQESSNLENPVVVAMEATDHSVIPQAHHQITITSSCVSSTAAEAKYVGKRFGFQRSPHTWIINPRRILFFFATLSCMGTIVLIYFTLSMGKLNGEDNPLN